MKLLFISMMAVLLHGFEAGQVTLLTSLMVGILHAFEPDHVTAVTVMASEKADLRENLYKAVWRSIKWAMGHSVTLLIFTFVALFFNFMTTSLQYVTIGGELLLGPVMLWLGYVAIKRNHKLKEMMAEHKKIEDHEHDPGTPFHIHGKQGEEIAMDPRNRSFWIGMLHGLAGSGGAVPFVLGLAANSYFQAFGVIGLQGLGITIAMAAYSWVLVYSVSRFVERNQRIFKYINGIAGLASILVGVGWLIFWGFKHFGA